jgi:glycosyltransferase involved in cell wall biosynthesis
LDWRVDVRVLIVTQYFWPETFPINSEVERLHARGLDVTVLTGKPNYPGGRIFDGYRARGQQRERHNDVEVFRVPLLPRGGNSSFRLAMNYISFALSASVFGPLMLRGRAVDAVFVYAPSPLIQALAGIVIARIKRAPLLLWVQDLWPESLNATGFVRNPLILSAVRIVVRFIYRRCDRILAPSRTFTAPIVASGADPSRIHYLPNSAPDSDIEPAPNDPQAREAAHALAERIAAHFSIVFTGNLGQAQGLDTVLEAAGKLRDLPDLRIFLVGSGRLADKLSETIARLKLNNVDLPGSFAQGFMPVIQSHAAALLVTLRPERIFAYTVPSKMQSYLAMGRPIVAALDGEGAAILSEAGAGLASPAGDARALAQTIRRLYGMDESERQRMGRAGRAYFEAHFAPEIVTHEICRQLASVAGAMNPPLDNIDARGT